jgi:DNA-binding winged helix-turn-helix (wHTH) protein/TolB-like protein/Flp pilus assembly protein TadD
MSKKMQELYDFDDFLLDASRRIISRGDEAVPLTSKAFETLLVLVRNRDRVLPKEELMNAVWPDSFVEEVNLAQNISAIRKALGESPGQNRFIATIPGKGYQFVCGVRERETGTSTPVDELVVARRTQAQVVIVEEAGDKAPTRDIARDQKQLEAPRRRFRAWPLAASGLVALAVMVGGGYWWQHRIAQSSSLKGTGHSLAVLPFQPLEPGTDDEHIGLGVADAVITKLSNIHQLPVRPTDVVIRYNNPQVDPIAAAREMGVDSVLSGKIQKSGDRMRVTVQLVQVSDGRSLWAQTFDENYTSIFAVEDSISEKVVQALAVNLAASEELQLKRHYTDNIDAYQNYLEGRYAEFTFTREGMNKAIAYFNHAIADDPSYALAYAGLADAYTTESDWLLAPKEALPKAEAAARKALAFDDNLAEAHGALAHALLHEWRLPESEREFHSALALNPGNVSTYFAYSEYLASTGKPDQAIAVGQQALAIDPLSPEINSFLAWDYYLKRDYDACLATSHKAMQMFPDFWIPHMTAGMCHGIRSENPQAIDEYKKALAGNPDSSFSQAGLGMSYAKSGKTGEAREALEKLKELSKSTYVSPTSIALIYLALGEKDEEFAWLNRGFEDQAEFMLWLPVDPIFDGERKDPRFKDLVRRVGVTQQGKHLSVFPIAVLFGFQHYLDCLARLQKFHCFGKLIQPQPVRNHRLQVQLSRRQQGFHLEPGLEHLAPVNSLHGCALEDDVSREVQLHRL